MLILNESCTNIKPVKEIDNYSVEQFLYESAEAYFELYKEAVALDVKVLQSKVDGIVEESALEAIEEANFGEMMGRVGKFIEEMFVNLFRLINWFKDRLNDAKGHWTKNKDKYVARAMGHTVSVHAKWDKPMAQLKVICDMLDTLEAGTKSLIDDLEKGEGLVVDKTKLGAEIKDKFDNFTSATDIVKVVAGDKVTVTVSKETVDTALLNISELLNDTTNLEPRVKQLKSHIESIIKGLDKSDSNFEAKNAALFQVLSGFSKSANAIVSAYVKSHEVLLADNKSFVQAKERSVKADEVAKKGSEMVQKSKELKDKAVGAVTGAKDAVVDKTKELEAKAAEK